MNVACRASIVLAAAACCTAGSVADETPSPEEFYRAALAQMQRVTEPSFVSYRTTVPSGHTSVVVRTDRDGYAKVSIRASTAIEPERTWEVYYRGADGAASIALPDQPHAITTIPLFDPTWRGAFRWMRRGILGTQAEQPAQAAAPQVPDVTGTAPPVIAVVRAFGTSYYDVVDAGPLPCTDGRPGRHLHLIARSDPVEHPLTDVVVDLASMRFCTMRFHQTVKSGMNNGFFDIDLHFADTGGYYLITDGRVTGGLRLFLLAAFRLDTTFAYDRIQLPASLPAALFEPQGASFTPAPL